MNGDDLEAIEPWIGALLQTLSPRDRRKLAMKVGQFMRRENARRIAANVQPDGSSMEPRKRRTDRKTGKVRRGKMFRKIARAKSLKVRPSADGVEVSFTNPNVAATAAVHHFGQEGYVGKTRRGRVIRTRYAERRLLGFGEEDRAGIMDMVLLHLTGA